MFWNYARKLENSAQLRSVELNNLLKFIYFNFQKEITKKWETVHLDVLTISNQKRIFKWNFVELGDKLEYSAWLWFVEFYDLIKWIGFNSEKQITKKWETAHLDVWMIYNQKRICKWNFLELSEANKEKMRNRTLRCFDHF